MLNLFNTKYNIFYCIFKFVFCVYKQLHEKTSRKKENLDQQIRNEYQGVNGVNSGYLLQSYMCIYIYVYILSLLQYYTCEPTRFIKKRFF